MLSVIVFKKTSYTLDIVYKTVDIPFFFRVRTSSGMFLRRGRDKLVRDVEKRIADFSFIPVGMRFKIIPM